MRISLFPVYAGCSNIWALLNGFEAIIILFTKDGVGEILNLQPKGALAKPYQVRQVRGVIVQYQLGGEDDGEV
jgi:hypothetical protein